ncbi:Imm1 family immunity protein [Streptomyces sp. t39]|uniref:Imm1 family immunity protein n=1 Tax=Streptomyces sp. t39 TaxID=1828156 RepID=UPI00164F5E6E|nr:Imm1 family immunity protein [Streptomyces sp. t39]
MEFKVRAYYNRSHIDGLAVISTPEDVDTLIEALASGPEFENMATLYSLQREFLPTGVPDHEFLIGANRERLLGIVSYIDDANYLSLGSPEARNEEIVEYYIDDNAREFPASAEIPIPIAREAVKEFLLSGGQRPTCVAWQKEPEI